MFSFTFWSTLLQAGLPHRAISLRVRQVTSPIAGTWEKKGYKGVMNKESLDSIPSCMFLAEAGSLMPAEKVN